MDIIELPVGENASDDTDRVTINVLPSGKAGFSGVCQSGTVQVHFVESNAFPSEAAALDAAVSWAKEHRIERLYVERRA